MFFLVPRKRQAMKYLLLATFALVLSLDPAPAQAARIGDICNVRGVRTNQLVGYGLVVGLNGTGDSGQAKFTIQSTAAMLRRLGATLDPRQIQTKNAAAVVVTATLPAFTGPGTRIDVTVSSLGNAKSLAGGTLVQTPLLGADRQVYAVAQGPLLIGGFSASGASGSSVSSNHVTVGRVPQGAIVERGVVAPRLNGEGLVLNLRDPSFVTAQRIVAKINEEFGQDTAHAVNPGTVKVRVPEDFTHNPMPLIAKVQVLEVEPDARARVVIDERTGTIALGAAVRIREVAVAHGSLTVEITETEAVSQPGALSSGDTVTTAQSDVRVTEEGGSFRRVEPTATLSEVVQALNALGVKPREMVAIFQALRTAGALDAEIEVQ